MWVRMKCPNCGSLNHRRGGGVVWAAYMVLIALAMPLVLYGLMNAAMFAAIMIGIIILTNLVFKQRICADCGEQWKPGPG